jgi:hypothetical protein
VTRQRDAVTPPSAHADRVDARLPSPS